MDTKIKENIAEALRGLPVRLGAVATVGEDGKPHVASIYFDFDEDLNIYFITRASTQKFVNTLQNPSVAFLASSENPPKTIQIEGDASEVCDPSEQEKYFKLLSEYARSRCEKPPFEQMMNAEVMIVKITPVWARLGNFDASEDSEMFQQTS